MYVCISFSLSLSLYIYIYICGSSLDSSLAYVFVSRHDVCLMSYSSVVGPSPYPSEIPQSATVQSIVAGARTAIISKVLTSQGEGDQVDGGQELLRLLEFRSRQTYGTMLAGFVRLFAEDMLNGSCQMIYLCKIWRDPEVSSTSKMFTVASVGAGLLASSLAPIQDYSRLREVRDEERLAHERYVHMKSAPRSEIGVLRAAANDMDNYFADLSGISVRRALTNPYSHKASWIMHRSLVFSALVFWGSMAVIYAAVDVHCGQDPPKEAWLIFNFACMFCMMTEVWVVNHMAHGHKILQSCNSGLLLGVFMGWLARFDSFSDITNTLSVINCVADHPDRYSWFSIWGRKFYLIMDLGSLVRISLVMVVVFEAIPGITFLACRTKMTLALKLNEFSIVLTVLHQELVEDTSNAYDALDAMEVMTKLEDRREARRARREDGFLSTWFQCFPSTTLAAKAPRYADDAYADDADFDSSSYRAY